MKFPTPEEFSDWRRANPDRGVPLDAGNCPLAECLKDMGAIRPDVYCTWTDDYDTEDDERWQMTPEWAREWIHAYDKGKEINPLDPSIHPELPVLPAPVSLDANRYPHMVVVRP